MPSSVSTLWALEASIAAKRLAMLYNGVLPLTFIAVTAALASKKATIFSLLVFKTAQRSGVLPLQPRSFGWQNGCLGINVHIVLLEHLFFEDCELEH